MTSKQKNGLSGLLGALSALALLLAFSTKAIIYFVAFMVIWIIIGRIKHL